MFAKTLLPALAIISKASLDVWAQDSGSGAMIAAGLFGLDGNIQGEQVGVGAEGTTYVYSNVITDTEDTAMTVTFVQDATHLVEMASVSLDESEGFNIEIRCGFASGSSEGFVSGDCTLEETAVFGTATMATTIATSGVTLIAGELPVSTASGGGQSVAVAASTNDDGSVVTSTGEAAPAATSNSAGRMQMVFSSGLIITSLGLSSLLV